MGFPSFRMIEFLPIVNAYSILQREIPPNFTNSLIKTVGAMALPCPHKQRHKDMIENCVQAHIRWFLQGGKAEPLPLQTTQLKFGKVITHIG
jgi:hypothetical protein